MQFNGKVTYLRGLASCLFSDSNLTQKLHFVILYKMYKIRFSKKMTTSKAKKHYNTSEARKCLGDIVNEVKYKKIIISLGRRDEGEVYIIPKPELNEELPVTLINSASPSFNFLDEEPDIYSLNDLKKSYL
jgi:hypothetical protein